MPSTGSETSSDFLILDRLGVGVFMMMPEAARKSWASYNAGLACVWLKLCGLFDGFKAVVITWLAGWNLRLDTFDSFS